MQEGRRLSAHSHRNCRPLADLYVRRDYTSDFRIRVQLESGQRYVITIREELNCILDASRRVVTGGLLTYFRFRGVNERAPRAINSPARLPYSTGYVATRLLS
jgi:hypothetical protein